MLEGDDDCFDNDNNKPDTRVIVNSMKSNACFYDLLKSMQVLS